MVEATMLEDVAISRIVTPEAELITKPFDVDALSRIVRFVTLFTVNPFNDEISWYV